MNAFLIILAILAGLLILQVINYLMHPEQRPSYKKASKMAMKRAPEEEKP